MYWPFLLNVLEGGYRVSSHLPAPAKGGLGDRKDYVLLIIRDDSKVKDRILNFHHAVEFLHNPDIQGLCLSKLRGSAILRKFVLAQASLEIRKVLEITVHDNEKRRCGVRQHYLRTLL